MIVAWSLMATGMLQAQTPPVHYYHQGVMPPGAIGAMRLQRGGPLPGFYQPVEIKAPAGALISLADNRSFGQDQSTPLRVGLLIGGVYRLRVTNMPLAEGVEVFPTVEIIDRLYTPPEQQDRFAIPIDLTDDDLKLAAAGKFVTRVIYLEDPRQALPARSNLPRQNWFEAAPGQDPLAVADTLGRPVAILRLGGRLPISNEGDDSNFYFNSPPFVVLRQTPAPAPSAPPPAKPNVQTVPPPRILPVLPGMVSRI
jgi:hypothetical protein